jgi:hypothetical protein
LNISEVDENSTNEVIPVSIEVKMKLSALVLLLSVWSATSEEVCAYFLY